MAIYKELKQQILSLIAANRDVAYIAKELGMTEEVAMNIINSDSKIRHRYNKTQKQLEENKQVVKLYLKGYKIKAIEQDLNLTNFRVLQALRLNNISVIQADYKKVTQSVKERVQKERVERIERVRETLLIDEVLVFNSEIDKDLYMIKQRNNDLYFDENSVKYIIKN